MPRPSDVWIVVAAGAAALATIALGIAVSIVYAGLAEYHRLALQLEHDCPSGDTWPTTA